MDKRILLVYGYSQKNAGDLAITLGVLDILLSKDYSVTILSRYNKRSTEYFDSLNYYQKRYADKIKVIECPFTLNREASKFQRIVHHLDGGLYLMGLKKDKVLENEIKKCGFVVFNGGNLLRSSSYADYLRLNALFYPINRAVKQGKEYIVFPQSTAEIDNRGEPLIKKFINNAKAVYLREKLSYDKLKTKYGFQNLRLSLDCAFFIDEKQQNNIKETNLIDKRKVAFTFRAQTVGDLKEFPKLEIEKIKKQTLKIISDYSASCSFEFVIQTRKDKAVTEYIKQRAKEELGIEVSIYENYDPVELIQYYSKVDLLIGMRLHSIILALSCGTPCMGMFYSEWGLKNAGLMEHFNLPYIEMDRLGSFDESKAISEIFKNYEEIGSDILKKVNEGKEALSELI